MPEEIELLEERYFLINSYFNASGSIVTFNRPEFIKKHHNSEGDSFFLITKGTNENELVGSVTWGSNGFDFKISFEENEGNFETMYRITRHSTRKNSETICEEILEAGFNLAFTTCSDRVKGIEPPDARPRGYCFKKRQGQMKTKIIPTDNTLIRLLQAKSENVLNQKFYDFALLHSKKLVFSLTR